MARICTHRGERGTKIYTVETGQIVSLTESDKPGDTYMILSTCGRRPHDNYVESVNVVNLRSGHIGSMHGSQRVVHHKGAAVVLDYVEGA